MSKQFRGIRPEDMTKLQQIAEMMSRGSVKYASMIADSIDESVAREVADILVRRATDPGTEFEAFARDLETSAIAHKHEAAVA